MTFYKNILVVFAILFPLYISAKILFNNYKKLLYALLFKNVNGNNAPAQRAGLFAS